MESWGAAGTDRSGGIRMARTLDVTSGYPRPRGPASPTWRLEMGWDVLRMYHPSHGSWNTALPTQPLPFPQPAGLPGCS